MSAVYELNELEIDEISLVDQGANEGAAVMLMKRHVEEERSFADAQDDTVELSKRLEVAHDEIILQKMAGIAKRLWPNLSGSDETKAVVLKHVEALGGEARSAVLQFLAAADGALAERLVEKGVTQTGGDMADEALQFEQLAQDYAVEKMFRCRLPRCACFPRTRKPPDYFAES
jgi:hypothetical protein